MPPVRHLFSTLAIAAAVAAAPGSILAGQIANNATTLSDGARLNAALGRLARNPRDIDALTEAGAASLAAGDGDAAIGFYQKADALSPNTSRIKAGLAGAYVLTGDPASAIPLFDAAERLGMIDGARMADRALAFDMVGDGVTAQRYYNEALMAGPNEETSRRLALSQAIAGDRRGMEITLSPLLQRQDKASWRTRAFALAILGQAEEAESIAKSTMPASLAAGMTNYLRYMPKLTRAQQAAAANLGQFPRAAEIGRDDPRFALLVRTRPVVASATPSRVAVAKLAQRDEKLARDNRKDRSKSKDQPLIAAAAPQPPVRVAAADPRPTGELPPLRSASAAAAVPARVISPPVSAAVSKPSPYTFEPVRAGVPTPVAAAAVPAAVAVTAVTAPAASAQTPLAAGAPVATPSASPPVAAALAAPASVAVPAAAPAPPSVATAAPAGSQPGFASLDNPSTAFSLKPSVVAPPPATAAPPAATPAPLPRPVAAKPAPAARPRNLAEVFADLTPPSREAEPKAGAVDLRKIKTAAPDKAAIVEPKAAKSSQALCELGDPKAKGTAKQRAVSTAKGKGGSTQCKVDLKAAKDVKDAKDAKEKAASAPSRFWAQVATGRDKKALAFDWRKLAKSEALLKGRKPYTAPWGQANRLLTGPFDTAAQATAFVAQLKKAGIAGAFVWNSPAGQMVDVLPGG
ncbi:SPOR domain-containing protein [Novosphingobium sp.]|uniref:SPOR domain-containing protein n=1 Tax=Novosphingobium sp. TaxID=1874826 RepID=UPI0025DA9380|nr:SPOR domain-containing protein [Novosphingobium sp.]